MIPRSLLFVPGDSERKIAKAGDSGADALILDLEDSVAPSQKPRGREIVAEYLRTPRSDRRQLWVRINPLDTAEALHDIAIVAAGRPDALLLPKASGAADVERLATYLDILEVREGITPGAIKVAVVATETGASLFGLSTYRPETPRLVSLTWGAEDLAAAVGAMSNADADGNLTPLYRMARGLCLAASAAAQVEPLDTAFMSIRDLDALARNCDEARRDGFRGKMAIHPDQVAVINSRFTPSEAELAEARAVVAAFAAAPSAGALQLNGRMIDIPHLRQAERILAFGAQPGNPINA